MTNPDAKTIHIRGKLCEVLVEHLQGELGGHFSVYPNDGKTGLYINKTHPTNGYSIKYSVSVKWAVASNFSNADADVITNTKPNKTDTRIYAVNPNGVVQTTNYRRVSDFMNWFQFMNVEFPISRDEAITLDNLLWSKPFDIKSAVKLALRDTVSSANILDVIRVSKDRVLTIRWKSDGVALLSDPLNQMLAINMSNGEHISISSINDSIAWHKEVIYALHSLGTFGVEFK